MRGPGLAAPLFLCTLSVIAGFSDTRSFEAQNSVPHSEGFAGLS